MRILVTGASGLIGGELCARLAARGHAVTALVHRRHQILDNHGRPLPSRAEGPPPAPGELVTRAGDVRAENLGLAAPPAIDLIVHSAAVTAFDAEPALYEAVNIGGTRAALAVAQTSGAALLHVSTAYVCGRTDGPIAPGFIGQAFTNGYEASKARAEALVRAGPVPHAVARPSVVVGDWAQGRISRFENIYMISKLIAEGRVKTLPAASGATLDLVPIDHVITGLLTMCERFADFTGQTVHLVAHTPTPVPAIGEAMARARVGTPDFISPDAFSAAALPPREARWHAAAAALYTAYLLRAPAFEAGHPLIPACPPTDSAWLDRLIGFALASGFVKEPLSPSAADPTQRPPPPRPAS